MEAGIRGNCLMERDTIKVNIIAIRITPNIQDSGNTESGTATDFSNSTKKLFMKGTSTKASDMEKAKWNTPQATLTKGNGKTTRNQAMVLWIGTLRIKSTKANGMMIFNMGSAHTTGSMEKYSTRSSRIFIRAIGYRAKDIVLALSFTLMDADMRDTLIKTQKMAKALSWMKMETLSWNISKKINCCIPSLKVMQSCWVWTIKLRLTTPILTPIALQTSRILKNCQKYLPKITNWH
jgi:hypothetical protein